MHVISRISHHSFTVCTEGDASVSKKCPWAWMFRRGQHADEGDHDTAEDDGDEEHHDPNYFWDGHGCPLGFKNRGGLGNWGVCCPLRNATCPMGFGSQYFPLGFGRRRSFCPMGFGGFTPYSNFCPPMGFGRGFSCPFKGYGMYGGYGCPLGFKPGSSGCPLRNSCCPVKSMDCCPMGFKKGGSGCPLRKSSCPAGFGKGKQCAKKEEPKASGGEVRSLLSLTPVIYSVLFCSLGLSVSKFALSHLAEHDLVAK